MSKSLLYLQILNVKSALFGIPETIDHSFKLKIMLNTTAVRFMKVIVRVVKTVRNVVLRCAQHKDPHKQSEPAKHLKFFPDHQF